MLSGEHHGSITRVNTSIFHMFRDSIFHHLTLVSNCVELNLLGVLHEL